MVVYPTQPIQPVSNIPTTLIVTTMLQSQAQPVVSQPQPIPSSLQPQVSRQGAQVSQVVVQQPLVSSAQRKPQVSVPLSGTTQAHTGTVNPQLGQYSSTRQQQTIQ